MDDTNSFPAKFFAVCVGVAILSVASFFFAAAYRCATDPRVPLAPAAEARQ